MFEIPVYILFIVMFIIVVVTTFYHGSLDKYQVGGYNSEDNKQRIETSSNIIIVALICGALILVVKVMNVIDGEELVL